MCTISWPSASLPWIEPTTSALRAASGSPSRTASSSVPRTEWPNATRRPRTRKRRSAGVESATRPEARARTLNVCRPWASRRVRCGDEQRRQRPRPSAHWKWTEPEGESKLKLGRR